MLNEHPNTRFTSQPVVYVNRNDERVYVTSDELHETFLLKDGEWNIEKVSRLELTISYRKVKDLKKAWQIFHQALSEIGYI